MFDGLIDSLEIYAQPTLRFWARLTFTSKLRSRFYRKLAALIDNGIKLSDAIKTLQARAAKRGETETMAIILSDVQITLERGDGLATALRSWTDPLECMGIAAGEDSGKIVDALYQAAESLGYKKEIIVAVFKAIIYPVILGFFTVAFLYFIGDWYVPSLSSIVNPDQFTGIAASVISLSNFVLSIWFWLLLILLVWIISTILALMPQAFGNDRFRVKLDNIPPWSIYRLIVGSNFLVALSNLLKAGVQLKIALQNCKKYANPYLAIRLEKLLIELSNGKNFGEAFDSTEYQFPDRDIIDDLITYSDLPDFDKILTEYGKESIKEAVEAVKIQAVIMNSGMFLASAMLIGWAIFGVLQLQLQLAAILQQLN